MIDTSKSRSFMEALNIKQRDVVCLVGAGGKTSLMFRLAEEARLQGYRVLVSTTTRLMIPEPNQYDAIDLSGMPLSETVTVPGIYVRGQAGPEPGKMTGTGIENLARQLTNFDLVLLEADGAAGKPLKGWNGAEPVIPRFTTKTIGIIDIQSIGQIINRALVHRLEIFLELTTARVGEAVSISHILRIISHRDGIFKQAQGKKLLYINKVESDSDRNNANSIRNRLSTLSIAAGSVQQGLVHV